MNKKGITGGVLIIIGIVLVLAYTQGYLDFILKPEVPDIEEPGKCPSSGLTQITINTQEALAATTTDSVHDYYVFDKSGVLVGNGNSGADGQSVFDVGCAVNKKYDVIVLNDTDYRGFYAQTFEIDASESTFEKNLQTYEYGGVDISNIGSDADPAGIANVSSGLGKTCGFTITFTVNETACAYNKPLLICQANSTGVEDITMSGVTPADTKKPTRITSWASINEFWTFELDDMIKSTDAAQKVSGKIQFSASNTPDLTLGNMTCQVIDQARYKKVDYKTLSLDEGFVYGGEDDANGDVGGDDSDIVALYFQHGTGYC